MKLNIKDFPFIILVEDKVGKTSGKMYQSISLGLTSVKNREALNPKDKYKTDFISFFDEKDLLKLSQLCITSYNKIKAEREAIKEGKKLSRGMVKPTIEDKPLTDDEVPF